MGKINGSCDCPALPGESCPLTAAGCAARVWGDRSDLHANQQAQKVVYGIDTASGPDRSVVERWVRGELLDKAEARISELDAGLQLMARTSGDLMREKSALEARVTEFQAIARQLRRLLGEAADNRQDLLDRLAAAYLERDGRDTKIDALEARLAWFTAQNVGSTPSDKPKLARRPDGTLVPQPNPWSPPPEREPSRRVGGGT
jgi:hypothetical protein